MIKIEHLSKSFGKTRALDDVSLQINDGSVYGLLGENGAGKTTLLRHLTGVYKPSLGNVLIDEEPVFDNTLVKADIAYIPDDIYYFRNASTNDMMKLYKNAYPNFDTERFNSLQEVFVSVNPKKMLRRLSKGLKRQAMFWLTLCCGCRYLILDEPVDGLDPIIRKNIWSLLMSDVAEKNTTIIISSHNLRELENVCDHFGILSHGRLIVDKSVQELQQNVHKLQTFDYSIIANLPGSVRILSNSNSGRLFSCTFEGDSAEIKKYLQDLNPDSYDNIPLTLEDIFINEIGGISHEQSEALL